MSDNKTCLDEKLPNYKPYSYPEIFVNDPALIKSDEKSVLLISNNEV